MPAKWGQEIHVFPDPRTLPLTGAVATMPDGCARQRIRSVWRPGIVRPWWTTENLTLPKEYSFLRTGAIYAAPPVPFPGAATLRGVIVDNATGCNQIVAPVSQAGVSRIRRRSASHQI